MQRHLPMKAKILTLGMAFGLAGFAHGASYQPVPLTPSSFTFGNVVPVDYLPPPSQLSCTVNIDQGPQYLTGGGDGWCEIGAFPGSPTIGLPRSGHVFTNASLPNHLHLMQNYSASNNVLFISSRTYTNGLTAAQGGGWFTMNPQPSDPNFANTIPNYNGSGQTVTFFTNGNLVVNDPTDYVALSFLTGAGGGGTVMNVTIQHADGVNEVFNSIQDSDWFTANRPNINTPGGSTIPTTNQWAWLPNGRINASSGGLDNSGVTTGSHIYSWDVPLADTTSPVTNVNFAYVSGGNTTVFGISGSTDNVNFAPVASLTGFNADGVVEATPLPLPYNATMDNGTNITSGGAGANTWFEIGWDFYHYTNGFPAHNTTFVSTNTGRSYQMAPTYHGPMSALCDTNHQLVNITPQTPASYTAFSLLVTGGSIGAANTMSNILIMQHLDGTAETNIFNCYDWFNNNNSVVQGSVPAYSANGRTSFNGARAYNTDPNPPTGDPKIYESQFILHNSRSPVTNMQIKYYNPGSNYGGNWTTFVFGVSATAGGIPLTIDTNTLAQNVYAGGTANFVANVIAGNDANSAPHFKWQYSATEYGAYANLTDGVNGVSGSSTSNLVISAASGVNVGFYQCVVTNTVSTNITFGSPLTLLVSTAADISQPGDPITDFGSGAADPAGQGPSSLVDGTLAKWLNFGGNGAAPFAGPVGYVTTPNIGNSIVTAMRFIVASDAPERDPVDYLLEGSNDGINFATVSSGALTLPDTRNENLTDPVDLTDQVLQEVDFANASGYYTYRVTFQNVKTNTIANSIQISEVQLLGTLTHQAPGILAQPAGAQKLYVGETFLASIIANGPTPISYYWYNGPTLLPSQTTATLTLNNVQLSDSGTYSCVVSNQYGTTNSTSVMLTVLARPAGYASTILSDNPIAYWRLDEGPDNGSGNTGTVANDYVGSHNGVYTNAQISQPGYSIFDPDTAAGFGLLNTSASFVGGISGINFFNPTNLNTGKFSIEAWVQAAAAQPVAGAGIVCLGLSGGGEQFALDCGGNAPNGFRFYFRDANTGASYNAQGNNPTTGTNGTADGLWHHLVGVLDEANSNQFLYIDGLPVSQIILGTNLGVLNDSGNATNPFTIGSRSVGLNGNPTNFTMNFSGEIDEVAVYNYPLTAAQVQAHYLAAGIIPVFLQKPVSVSGNEGGSASFTSQGYGSPTLHYQWWNSDGSAPTTSLGGQTSSNLTFNALTAGQNGLFYQLVITNTYGGITSAAVQLTVVSGPPQIITDLTSPIYVYAGYPLVLDVTVGGTLPFQYGWQYNGSGMLANGGRISGANSNVLTISPSQLSDGGTYQLFVTNGQGTAQSAAATVTVVPVLTFNGTGGGWSFNTGGAGVNGYVIGTNAVQLTDNVGGEATSTFFTSPVYIGGFRATFTYIDVTGGGADGVTFCIQNDPRGAAALGGGGGSLGFGTGTTITPAADLQFNVYSGHTIGFAFVTNGSTTVYTPAGAVGIGTTDPIEVGMTYLNGVATLNMTDAVTAATFTASTPLSLAGLLGSNLAYVGFTGGDGGVASTQIITNFTFVSLIPLAVQHVGGNVVLSWPTGTGGYQLESNTAINSPGTWTIVATPPVIVGGQNQVTLPVTPGPMYYRLVNP